MWEVIIPAAANLIGGMMNNDAVSDANTANINNQNAINERNIALQREFAQHGIRWKVEDAKAAGLHPLAALGAQTTSFSPISVGATVMPEAGLGGGIAEMGQNIGRAISASSTNRERRAQDAALANVAEMRLDFERQNHSLDVERKWLENSLLRSELARKAQQENPPAPASLTGAQSPGDRYSRVKFKPAEVTSANPFNQSRTAGPPGPGTTRYRFGGPYSGFNVDLPSGSSVSEGLESMGALYSLYTMGRHNLSQWFDDVTRDRSGAFIFKPELLRLLERR